ncbi:MAG: amidase family protein, partial [Bacteroidota bacterium]
MKLFERSAVELNAALRKREISAREVLLDHFARIDEVEPEIRAFTNQTRERAIEQADAVDGMLQRGEELSPLAGIPLALKDNLCTEGVRTTCSSRMLEHFVPPYDATVVRLLREQGVVFLGKAN